MAEEKKDRIRIDEAIIKKGGLNDRPTVSRPSIPPSGQAPSVGSGQQPSAPSGQTPSSGNQQSHSDDE